MWYQVALFVHITGALMLFISLGLEWFGLTRLRRAEHVEQVRELSALLRVLGKLIPSSIVLILGGGLYMAITVWGFAFAWLDAALTAVVVMTVLGNVLSSRRLAAIGQMAFTAPDGPLSPDLRARTTDPVLIFWSRIGVLIGWWIVFLMTLKPALLGTLVSLGVALVLGACFAHLSQRALRHQPLDPAQTLVNPEVAQSARR